ncbi:hypothetical protein AJ88_42655 [Mesorhizobium amorphae CCBAU 01583]|nr:hypothetical protein AJ88_42655 [Mesorhizobium amorphae CCBAU 01583]
MFGQHGEVAEDFRQLAVAFLVEMEFDLAVRDSDRIGDVLEIAAVLRAVGFSTWNDQITSSTVIGWPSCHFARGSSR